MTETFHTKYRPKTLDRVIGQEAAVTRLQSIVASGKVPNAMLFAGPSSAGKTTLARAFTASLFGVKSLTGHPDYTELNAADSRGIDDVRDMLKVARLRPRQAKKRVILLDEAQGFTGPSAELLLKPLEHPPEHTLFILGSMEPEKLKTAMKNRCSQFILSAPGRNAMRKYVKRIVRGEEMSYMDDALIDTVVQNSQGEMRTAANLMEALAQTFYGTKKTPKAKDVDQVLQTVASNDDRAAVDVLAAVYQGKAASIYRRLLDVEDGFRFIGRLLTLNTFLINNQALKGEKHRAVWWSKYNGDLYALAKEALGDRDQLEAYSTVQTRLIAIRSASGSFMVPETTLIGNGLYRAVRELHGTK